MTDWTYSVTVKIRRVGNENHMAARDNTVYAENINGHAVNAAFDGSVEKYPEAIKTDHAVGEFDDWLKVEMVEGEGQVTWYARPVYDNETHTGDTEIHAGDTPAEAALIAYYTERPV